MKLHLLSDLHLEFASFDPPATDADVVVLAGDIYLGAKAVEWAADAFRQPVLLVPGNHEYYGGHLDHTPAQMRRMAEGTQVRVLDGETVVMGAVRFVAASLWTDFLLTRDPRAAQREAQLRMTDYRRIHAGRYRLLRTSDTVKAHAAARAYLERTLQEPFDGSTVVITHHAPSERSIVERFRTESHLNAAYASDLEVLMGPDVALWVHGHTHASLDYRVNGTRVVCNPRGYVPLEPNPGFNPGLVLEVD
jgi:predicted phosphodiesterase